MTRVLSSRSVSVSWGPILNSNDRNGIISTYTVNITNNQTGDVAESYVTTGPEETSRTFENLEEYTGYYVQVAGSTRAGLGPFSPSVYNQTLEDGKFVSCVICHVLE